MAVYRTRKEYLLVLVLVLLGALSYYKTAEYQSLYQTQTTDLRQQLDSLRSKVISEFQARDKHVLTQNDHKVKELSEGLSDLGEETKGLSDKVPQLESIVSYLSSKLQDERVKYNDTISNVEKTFAGLMSKIGALEGVINDLHSHHEEHEATHLVKEKELLEKHVESHHRLEDAPERNIEGNGGIGNVAGVVEEEEHSGDDVSTVLLVVASPNRPDYLKKSLSYIANYHPKSSVPVMVSEDGDNRDVDTVVKDAFQQMRNNGVTVPLVHMHHPFWKKPAENGYFKLSRHFKWALNELFSHPLSSGLALPRRIIIIEEDLQIAPDFFEFFAAVAPMVDNDPTVLAASAWNDNGVKGYVHDPEALYRSDFFPGLGWMISSKIWQELSPIWPNAYWDDWLREPLRRKGRHIIRPEVCRTFHYGKKGVSNNQYSKFLDDIQLNEKFVPFTSMDLSYLESNRWEQEYTKAVLNAKVVESSHVDHRAAIGKMDNVSPEVTEVTVYYQNLREFEKLAKNFGVMDNIKANVPRTAYHGIVSFWQKDTNPARKIHLAPIGIAETLKKTVITSNTDYDQAPSSSKRNFLRHTRIQY